VYTCILGHVYILHSLTFIVLAYAALDSNPSTSIMSSSSRQYDIILFGATGHTGKLTAAYIAKNAPTDIKWAIAGRSVPKLEAVADTCKSLNPDRIQPGNTSHFYSLSCKPCATGILGESSFGAT
jgi:hypothetical protein